MANVKVFVVKQTDGWAKNYMPPIYPCRALINLGQTKFDAAKMMISVFDSVENIVGKGVISSKRFKFFVKCKVLLYGNRVNKNTCIDEVAPSTLSQTSPGFYMSAAQVF